MLAAAAAGQVTCWARLVKAASMAWPFLPAGNWCARQAALEAQGSPACSVTQDP